MRTFTILCGKITDIFSPDRNEQKKVRTTFPAWDWKICQRKDENMERINRDVGDTDDVRVGWLVFLEAWEEVATLEYFCYALL